MEDYDDGCENGLDDENEENANQIEGNGAVGSEIGGHRNKMSGGMVTGGAARGLRSGQHQHNI